MSNILFTAKRTLKNYASGGNILIIATLLALVIANIPAINHYYFDFWSLPMSLQIGDFNLFSHNGHAMTVMQFINDALMAIFFFTIGLEIKREVLVGELSSFKQALLPIVAAIGGMVLPVGIFMFLGRGSDFLGGAAIPMATDIAFSLGVLAMLGSRVPTSLKMFLTTLAVVDDIGGILVIAIFYSSGIEYMLLIVALFILGLLFLGSKFQIQSKIFYFALGGIVWFLFLNSGIHPTIAGVLIAFCIPATPVFPPKKYIVTIRERIANFPIGNDESLEQKSILKKDQLNWLKEIESASDKMISPLQELEDSLHPVVNYFIIPLFAFANAGIFFGDMSASSLFEGVSISIIAGLLIGKFFGIFIFSWAIIKMKLVNMPDHSNWKMLAAVSMLGGIGFTVSLFIANLSFGSMGVHGAELLNSAKLGIIVGSLLAGVLGYIFLSKVLPKHGTIVE
ncbi:MAG: Na+/H+ antiporter NhaA [Muribaculaceae bacterium]